MKMNRIHKFVQQFLNLCASISSLGDIQLSIIDTLKTEKLHRTAISVFQFPTVNNNGICRDPFAISSERKLSEYSLPNSHTNVPAVTCKTNELALPLVECTEFNGCLELAKAEEKN